ncbi:MAG: AAA family ATPase [Deltaproteobacteria bacterium]|nr:AAA family ATPase [Deltaproteobacteria bacterium]
MTADGASGDAGGGGPVGQDDGDAGEGGPRTLGRRSRALDEAELDEVAALLAWLPEPLAAVAAGVEVARIEGDATGVRKQLFELGSAVVRYAVSVGLALLGEALAGRSAPPPLAQALGRAARLSDGGWCQLARSAAAALEELRPESAPLLAFAAGKPLAELVAARNRFAHEGGRGDDAPALALAVVDAARPLLERPLRVVAALDPPTYQERAGVPLRAGAWRRQRGPLPAGAEPGRAYVVEGDRWTPLAPWLPEVQGRLLLVDSPHAPGKPWRSADIETGEHREHEALDRAIRALCGKDASAPVAPTEQPALVGREVALDILRRGAEHARAGAISVVALTGVQGIGRSRLLRAVREAAAGFGMGVVIEAACVRERRGLLRPLRRAVEGMAGLEAVKAALGQAASGQGGSAPEAMDASIEAVEEALVETSRADAILLLVDDAQWADAATLRLLTLLTERATRGGRGQLLVVVAVCDEPGAPAELVRLIGEIERDVGAAATRHVLGPLDDGQAARLVQGVAPVAREIERALVGGAAGQPFLLVQPLLAWVESGALRWRDGAWHPVDEAVLARAVPGVMELVQARVASFFAPGSAAERTAQQVLVCAALAGTLGMAALCATLGALGADMALVEHAVEALSEAGLLDRQGQRHEYGFDEPMVRRAVLEALGGRPWAVRLHRALLEALGRSTDADEDAAFLAEGYLQLDDRPEAVRWLWRAVDHGLRTGLFLGAARAAERLAGLARDPAERARAELAAADALLRAGQAKEAQEKLRAVAPAARGVGAALGVRARTLALTAAFELGQAGEHPDPALVEDADACGEPLLALEARLAAARSLRAARGLVLVDEALAGLPDGEAGDLRYRALVLRVELLAETRSLADPESRRALEQARAAARELGSDWAMLDAENDWAVMESEAGNHERALALMQGVIEQAREHHFGRMHRGALVSAATMELRAGAPAGAARRARLAVETARQAGDHRCLGMALSVVGDALRQMGRGTEALAALDDAVRIRLSGGDVNVAVVLFRRGELREELGDLPGALADADLALQNAQRVGNEDHIARARLWTALLGAGREPAALAKLEELVAELDPVAGRLRGPTRQLLERARALSPR